MESSFKNLFEKLAHSAALLVAISSALSNAAYGDEGPPTPTKIQPPRFSMLVAPVVPKYDKNRKSRTEPHVYPPPNWWSDWRPYMEQLQTEIVSHSEKLRQFHGKISIGFTVSKYGEISNIKLGKPSGNPKFDQLALSCLKESQPLPPLPREDSVDMEFTFSPDLWKPATDSKQLEQTL